ncbi:heme-binding Shp domain-containing protein [Gemella cuniculi]|uniref:heme-binding Shp domain-containing protein n=1 Tax=Gemella cuniculi TaxID=150240 RepID=UPI0004140827|nr:heme-binding Shp domain-containing protein [Gemella cuniculi]
MKKTLKFMCIVLTILVLIFSSINVKSENSIKATDEKVYNVPIELWHSENSGKLSMGNKALSPTATVTEHSNGTSSITVKFIPMDFSNMHGHLLSLSVYSAPIFSGSLNAATVTSTYNDTNLDGGTSTYPSTLNFNYNAIKPDKIGVRVSVDAMNQIMGGDASQNAIIKFKWDAATMVSSSKDENNKSEERKDSEKNSDENKNNEKTKSENKDENKVPEGFIMKKLEDYFKDSNNKTKNVGIYNLDITGSYLNPLTGITADGGTKNAAIGEGMVQGVISPINDGGDLNSALNNQKNSGEKRWSKAMLQRTKDGKLYATIRIHLMNWVERSNEQGPFIKVLQKDGEFKQVIATETKVNIEQYKDSYVDYRFEVPNENFLAMVQMYVKPMNRPVRYFVEVNTDTIKQGNDGLDMDVLKEKNYLPYYICGGIFILALVGGATTLQRKKKVVKEKNSDENKE